MSQNKAASFIKTCFNVCFEYETPKMVQINSRMVGAIFRVIQAFIFIYLVGWIMIKERGYQASDTAISGVTAKVKGVSYLNLSGTDIGERLFDVADYVVPPQQNSAFFIMTNMVSTDGQSRGTCPEASDVYKVKCKIDTDCKKGEHIMLGNGIKTGRCVESDQVANISVCEIYGWCPTEYDKMPLKDVGVITNAPNFTVLLKNSIAFPKFNVKRRNVLPWMKRRFLYTCNYEPNHPQKKYCPIFRIGDILKYANADTPDIWYKGGMVSIDIIWHCNLDLSEKKCMPEYSFRRLDDSNVLVAKGWNFRYGNYYLADGVEYRELIKAFGIQFFISVHGTAFKFDLYTFTMNVGSGVGLFGAATLICDMIIFNLLKNRRIYKNAVTEIASVKLEDKCDMCQNCQNIPIFSPEQKTPTDVLIGKDEMRDAEDIT